MFGELELDPSTVAVAAVAGFVVLVVFSGVFTAKPPKVSATGLEAGKWKKFKLEAKSNVSHNTRRFRFKLESDDQVLGLPVGKHMNIRIPGLMDPDEPEEYIEKPYTPTSSDDDLGWFELVIKIYPDGRLTPHLDKLQVNQDYIEVCGPLGRITYSRPGELTVERASSLDVRRLEQVLEKGQTGVITGMKDICMIAGGTGITPMLQVMAQIAKDSADDSRVVMIFGNVSINDILVRDELEALVAKHANIEVCFTVDKVSDAEKETWQGRGKEVGFVSKAMVEKYFPKPSKDVVVLECGPPMMMKFINKFLDTEMGYQILAF